MKNKLKLRCYVCGKDINPKEGFSLVSAGRVGVEVDRVFVTHAGDCLAEVAEDQPHLVVVQVGSK